MADESTEERAEDDTDVGAGDPDEPRRLSPWLVPALIGLVTISAGLVTWRAGQLGSAAAYQDRQSVGQTITQQQQVTEAGLGTTAQASAWVAYSASLAEAAALEDLASEAADQGRDDVAADLLEQADRVTTSANELAEAQHVFGTQELFRRETGPDAAAEDGGFNIEQRFETLKTDAASGVTSPGVLDPDAWAARADETRAQVGALRLATVFLLIAVAAYTVAELARHRSARLAGFVMGGVIYVLTIIAVIPSVV